MMSYQVAGDEFSHQIESACHRASVLKQKVQESGSSEPDALAISLEELQAALEELRVADEEIRLQNEELILTRAAAEAERQRYQELFEFAPDGYLVTDAAGVIQEANHAAASLLGILQKHLITKPLLVFIPDEGRQEFRSQLSRLQNQVMLHEWEVVMRSRTGKHFDAAITVTPALSVDGQQPSLRWMLRDITARKQAEERARIHQLQNLQLQEATKLKSQFLALMSHELRTPMNAILGFSQLLLRQSNSYDLPSNCVGMVERILNSGKHLLQLIEEILDFSKLESGTVAFNLQEINLPHLINTTVEDLQILAQQKQLQINVECVLESPFIVNDQTRLRQILVNLLSNAIKFTHTGSISVEVTEQRNDQIVIAVKDTGIGIAEGDLQKIFQEFHQVNQIMTRETGGTGLGLAICDRLVRMMHGKIMVESQPGEGSTFRVQLPRTVRL